MSDHRNTQQRHPAPCPEDAAPRRLAAGDGLETVMAQLYPGGVPNLYRMLMRHRPVMAGLAGLKHEISGGRLTETERGLVGLEVARDAECEYCTGALRHYLAHDLGAPEGMLCTQAEDLPDDPRARVVVGAARAILAFKGKLSRHDLGRLADNGLPREDLLEVIAVIGEYTIATYAANLDRTRLDPPYRNGALSPPREG